MKYFSVKRPLKILGKVYIPCVCYPIPKVLEKTVDKLVSEDTAVTYDKEVGFMNGKVLERTKKTVSKKSKKETVAEETVVETTDDTKGF